MPAVLIRKRDIQILAVLWLLGGLPLSLRAGTMGNTTPTPSTSDEINTIVGTVFTATTGFVATTLYVYVCFSAPNGGGGGTAGIYSVNASNQPQNLLSSMGMSFSQGNNWAVFTLSTPVDIIAGQSYFLGVAGSAGGNPPVTLGYGYGSGGVASWVAPGASLPNPMVSVTPGLHRAIYVSGPDFTASPTPTNTGVRSATITRTITRTRTSTLTCTRTASPSRTPTRTHSATYTPTPTATQSLTKTQSATSTGSPTSSPTLTATPTRTASPTWTITLTRTVTLTPTQSVTPTISASISPTPSITPTAALVMLRPGQVMVYPQPGVGKVLYFYYQAPQSGEVKIGIFNILGEKVKQLQAPAAAFQTQRSAWDTSQAAPGIYLVHIWVETASGALADMGWKKAVIVK